MQMCPPSRENIFNIWWLTLLSCRDFCRLGQTTVALLQPCLANSTFRLRGQIKSVWFLWAGCIRQSGGNLWVLECRSSLWMSLEPTGLSMLDTTYNFYDNLLSRFSSYLKRWFHRSHRKKNYKKGYSDVLALNSDLHSHNSIYYTCEFDS